MSKNLFPGALLSLAEAAKILPGNPHLSTLHRWRVRGIRGIKLATLKIGGRRFVRRDALEEFIAATTAAAGGQPRPVRTRRQREKAISQAEADLAGRKP